MPMMYKRSADAIAVTEQIAAHSCDDMIRWQYITSFSSSSSNCTWSLSAEAGGSTTLSVSRATGGLI